tara:strand:- start:4457 stop:5044 length:588 start_codon:yes stop_codon:yes gene_type:complete
MSEPIADKTLEMWIGAQVKTLRRSLGMTMADLSKATSVSVGMLSKIENGQTSPSLATLQALATALNIPLASFFQKYDDTREASYVKSGNGLVIERRGTRSGHIYQLLGAPLRNKAKMEPYLITLTENSDAYPVFQHPGVEFIYMLEGELIYRHDDKDYHLYPGDALHFDAEAPHGPLKMVTVPCKYLSIIASSDD